MTFNEGGIRQKRGCSGQRRCFPEWQAPPGWVLRPSALWEERFNEGGYLIEDEGFLNKCVNMRVVTIPYRLRIRTDDDDRDCWIKTGGNLISIGRGQLYIGNDKVKAAGCEMLLSAFLRLRNAHAVSHSFQGLGQRPAHQSFVLDNENIPARTVPGGANIDDGEHVFVSLEIRSHGTREKCNSHATGRDLVAPPETRRIWRIERKEDRRGCLRVGDFTKRWLTSPCHAGNGWFRRGFAFPERPAKRYHRMASGPHGTRPACTSSGRNFSSSAGWPG
jgi:hypothetical protein